jgi:hypothetical protein
MSDREVLQELEAERDRRVLDKVARGEAVLLPPKVAVVGVPKSDTADAKVEHDAQGKEVYRGVLREDGTIDPGINVIITGVPRAGRDDGEPVVQATNTSKTWKCSMCGGTFPNKVTIHRCEPRTNDRPKIPPPQRVQPVPKPEEAPRRYIWTQTRGATDTDPGAIAEGTYTVSDDWLYVWDAAGNHLGRLAIAPGDDAAVVARRLLRDKTGSNAFYAPLNYPTKTFH